VIVAWTFFRAPSFAAATTIIEGMLGRHGAEFPNGFSFAVAPLAPAMKAVGISFGQVSGSLFLRTWLWIGALGFIALALPNTQQIMCRFEPVLESASLKPPRRLAWRPSPGWAIVAGIAAFFGVASITRVSEFLYWQF
jgi:hypothetical protein